ncbi:hypothetical protein K0M31_012186 [Melipona bicolor]|uniref:Uncharacterized protein n=1 Tax=Melipona bicolor TaxID=60889 RepID=A0AA40KHK2_9HYME|nr:hypothetical protein K0M31_012186 [Melipona bicolor]
MRSCFSLNANVKCPDLNVTPQSILKLNSNEAISPVLKGFYRDTIPLLRRLLDFTVEPLAPPWRNRVRQWPWTHCPTGILITDLRGSGGRKGAGADPGLEKAAETRRRCHELAPREVNPIRST